MTEPRPRVLGSRVGRRVLLLFLAASLVPLGAMALLSFSQVRTLLLQQAGNRLAGTAKAYAVGVYDRLLVARDIAALAAVAGEQPLANDRKPFRWLARVDAQGRVDALQGTPPALAQSVAERHRASARWPRPWLSPPPGAGVVLSFAAPPGAEGAVVVGELEPLFLWGNRDDRPDELVMCVVDGGSFQTLYCPGGEAMSLPALLRRPPPPRSTEDVVWRREGEPHHGRVWGQFLQNDFGAPDWYFAASLPEGQLLAAADAFRRGFAPVVLLALLLTTLLSVNQIRAVLVPLAQLRQGTRRVAAGDFATRVPGGARDEFGELGEAFNAMSSRLGRQHALAAATEAIDRLVLERQPVERMVHCALSHAAAMMPALRLCAVVLDHRDAARGSVMALTEGDGGPGGELAVEPVDLPIEGRPDTAAPTAFTLSREGPSPQWLVLSDPGGTGAPWIQPLAWGETACGWLVALAPAAPAEEDRTAIGELGRRLAVGIALTWSDEELYRRIHYDPLTGLPNRRMFSDLLAAELARCTRDRDVLAVLYLDLDRFKAINDAQGQGAGDALLCEAAARIRAAVRPQDSVSRFGADEFAVLVTGLDDQRDALLAANRVIEALSAPFVMQGVECFLSASAGIALFPDNGRTPEALIERADTAMYRAKAAGRARALFFEERMNAEAAQRMSLEGELRHGIERGELVLHFQPQVALDRGVVVSAEALVRWQHPQRGLVMPGHFIPMAEETGLILALGRWVMEEACRQAVRWRAAGLAIERVSLNVSGRQLAEPGFVEFVRDTVAERGLAPLVEFEITETALLEQGERIERVLQSLSEFGIRLALDDFGTGFSSLAYLKRLPVDVVKIDRLFVDDVDRTPAARAFVQAMIAMSHALGKRVVAEGAERDTQVVVLRELGCDIVQGFFFSRPLPAAAFEATASSLSWPGATAGMRVAG